MIEIKKRKWQEEIDKVSFHTFFHTLEWLELVEKHYSWLKLKLIKSNGKLFPYFTYKNKVISLPFCEYGGPISNEKLEEKEIIKFTNYFKKYKISSHPFLLQQESDMGSYILELKNKTIDDLMQSFRKTTRHSIRYSQKENLIISEMKTEKDLKKFYKLYVQSMKKNYAFPVSFKFIKDLSQNKNIKTWIAKQNNQIVSGIMVIFYNKYAHYSKSCNIYRLGLHANYALIWHAIQYALNNGYHYFDFGATKKSAKLSVFKRGWGTQEYSIPTFTDQNQTGHQSKNDFLKKIWRKIPCFIFAKTSSLAHKKMFYT
ncbi:MAG: peptidoglycan bridge formation glycyltransferase FemA/FemB family protein [Nanoarchaeota archaeon]|nr:peptidoglycan bridge formation glycyltransferase FemA/FemB family protein [Nanoarchaeota archaeon]